MHIFDCCCFSPPKKNLTFGQKRHEWHDRPPGEVVVQYVEEPSLVLFPWYSHGMLMWWLSLLFVCMVTAVLVVIGDQAAELGHVDVLKNFGRVKNSYFPLKNRLCVKYLYPNESAPVRRGEAPALVSADVHCNLI